MPLLTPIYGGFRSSEAVESSILQNNNTPVNDTVLDSPSFLDVFRDIANTAVETGQQKSQDIIDLMLGNTDDIEAVQTNIAKAEFANDLLITVKNTVVEAYNEIIKMSI